MDKKDEPTLQQAWAQMTAGVNALAGISAGLSGQVNQQTSMLRKTNIFMVVLIMVFGGAALFSLQSYQTEQRAEKHRQRLNWAALDMEIQRLAGREAGCKRQIAQLRSEFAAMRKGLENTKTKRRHR